MQGAGRRAVRGADHVDSGPIVQKHPDRDDGDQRQRAGEEYPPRAEEDREAIAEYMVSTGGRSTSSSWT
jgi:hypothetical protein